MSKGKIILCYLLIVILLLAMHSFCFLNNIEFTKSNIETKLEELNSTLYEDGTYNLSTMEKISYTSGYQVSFYQIGDNYTEEEYYSIIMKFLKVSSDNTISAGKYSGKSEISFNIESKKIALGYAKEFNQTSVWDWENNRELYVNSLSFFFHSFL